jgi:hypothetical protein
VKIVGLHISQRRPYTVGNAVFLLYLPSRRWPMGLSGASSLRRSFDGVP